MTIDKVAPILLFTAFWTCTQSIATNITSQTRYAEQKMSNKGEIHAAIEWIMTFMLEFKAHDSSSAPGDETEDEGKTSKENVFHRMTSAHLSLCLQQLYMRQNAMYHI